MKWPHVLCPTNRHNRAVLDREAPLQDESDLKTRSEEGHLRAGTLLLRGQVQWARSEMAAAGASFTQYIREIRTLLHDDPDNRLLRHDLMLGLERSGDVAMSRSWQKRARESPAPRITSAI